MTLTPRGLMQLTRAGLLPHVTNEEVTEKSKANTAAKIMVCIQASWFLLQAVARLAQKLPLTLLEIHVLTHVLCALGMYFCWVDKPYDVGMPVVVDDELVKDMVALFLLDATPWFGTHKEEVSFMIFLVAPKAAHCGSLESPLSNLFLICVKCTGSAGRPLTITNSHERDPRSTCIVPAQKDILVDKTFPMGPRSGVDRKTRTSERAGEGGRRRTPRACRI